MIGKSLTVLVLAWIAGCHAKPSGNQVHLVSNAPAPQIPIGQVQIANNAAEPQQPAPYPASFAPTQHPQFQVIQQQLPAQSQLTVQQPLTVQPQFQVVQQQLPAEPQLTVQQQPQLSIQQQLPAQTQFQVVQQQLPAQPQLTIQHQQQLPVQPQLHVVQQQLPTEPQLTVQQQLPAQPQLHIVQQQLPTQLTVQQQQPQLTVQEPVQPQPNFVQQQQTPPQQPQLTIQPQVNIVENTLPQQPVETLITKNVYFHLAPEDPPLPPVVVPPPPPPKKSYNLIFIKAPSQPIQKQIVVQSAQQTEEKTLVYVLVDRPQQPQVIVPTPVPAQASKPEVYFIKYKGKGTAAVADAQPLVEDLKRVQDQPISSGESTSSLFSGGIPSTKYGPPGYQKRNA